MKSIKTIKCILLLISVPLFFLFGCQYEDLDFNSDGEPLIQDFTSGRKAQDNKSELGYNNVNEDINLEGSNGQNEPASNGEEYNNEQVDDPEEDPGEESDGEQFGEEISEIAQGLKEGEYDVEDLVDKATSRSSEVLENVKEEKVPQIAQKGLENAIEKSSKGNEKAKEAAGKPEADVDEDGQGSKNDESINGKDSNDPDTRGSIAKNQAGPPKKR